jgi:hypothetical protein
VRKEILSNITIYDEYDIADGETPEKIAFKFYGDAGLHWVIMLINERYDWVNDFPLTQQTLEDYVIMRYGDGNRDAHHRIFGELHYETPDGRIVDSIVPLAQAVTNYEYEFTQNETKRRIKLISPKIIQQLISELRTLFQDSIPS